MILETPNLSNGVGEIQTVEDEVVGGQSFISKDRRSVLNK
nr:MAG TPA: hypothetical protein [Bacteriophage sp.]